jgi:hypothetical protein
LAVAPPQAFVILNLFQDNAQPLHVILKQVQDDDIVGQAFVKQVPDNDGWRFLDTALRSAT